MNTRCKQIGIFLLGVIFLVQPVLSESAADRSYRAYRSFSDIVSVKSVKYHLKVLEKIASMNDNNRASGTMGYDISALYVATKLWLAGYKVTIQRFEIPYFEEKSVPVFEVVSPQSKSYLANDPQGFMTLTYSGKGDVTGVVQFVDIVIPPGETPNSNTSGCEIEDFSNFVPGNIALIQRGSCSFKQKALNAQQAGASAVIIFNEGQEGRIDAIPATLSDPELTIPVIFANYTIGEELYNLSLQGNVTVHVKVDAISETRKTSNIIADTRKGDPAYTAMLGAHLDGVLDGPGINDNGSGTATLLEIACKLSKLSKMGFEPQNRLRFAFWGAEEIGLKGSNYYVENLDEEERDNIALYLNFDMVGSPNYVRFVFDGDGSDTEIAGPPGSDMIEELFVNYFYIMGMETDPAALNGRSDYVAFMDIGLPIGGLFTGADGIKTEEQAAVYGGAAGEKYDAHYHTINDNLNNVNFEVLQQMLDAVTYAAVVVAMEQLPKPQIRAFYAEQAQEISSKFEYCGPYLIK